ncbi:TetR/AcrR family transcriptional regulator [uncultured Corynebacterium sp.]|uniref:TetR/AcrR family transcriptional regulator n=1 Tax=uncultured Corynebacterium sp. TaxID=159447 RepID=UPI0025E23F94|nr:TetR family transcriptional regulator [uncultured Corynebacterium sp.]
MNARVPVEERRANLVQAAMEIAEEKGVGAVTTRNVCNRADAHLSVFHYCFSGKGELVDLMIRETLDHLFVNFEKDSVTDTASFIRGAWRLLSDHWSRAFILYELVVHSARVERESDGDGSGHFESFVSGAEFLLDAFAERDGFRWAPDTRTVARIIVGMLAGIGMSWVTDHHEKPNEAGSSESLEAFIAMVESMQVHD